MVLSLCLISCVDPGNGFDTDEYNVNKQKWENSTITSYSFDFTITYSAGLVISATSVNRLDKTNTTIEFLYNKKYEDLSDSDKEIRLKSLNDSFFYLKDVESIYSCILNRQQMHQAIIDEDTYLKSVYVYIRYNNYGVPIYIYESPSYKKDKNADGGGGAVITISNFKIL